MDWQRTLEDRVDDFDLFLRLEHLKIQIETFIQINHAMHPLCNQIKLECELIMKRIVYEFTTLGTHFFTWPLSTLSQHPSWVGLHTLLAVSFVPFAYFPCM